MTRPLAATTEPVGVALAGGESRRMGSDKALLELGGRTLLAATVERLAEVCGEVLIADRGRGFAAVPARTPATVSAVADGPGRGPAAGILGAAALRPGRDLLVLACDLPGVPAELLRELTRYEGDWVVPLSPWGDQGGETLSPWGDQGGETLSPWGDQGGETLCEERLEPLCAIYRPPCLAALREQVANGTYALHRLSGAGLRVRRLGPGELGRFGDATRIFRNLNAPEDLAALRDDAPAG